MINRLSRSFFYARVAASIVLIYFCVPTPAYARQEHSFRIDPSFSEDRLTTEQKRWYGLLSGYIASSKRDGYSIRAALGDINSLGRGINTYLSLLLSVFRLTGDRRLLAEVDRIMELERAQLKDCARHYSSMQHAQSDGSPIPTLLDRYPCEADGFRNLIRLRESQDQEVSAIYFANDEHQMDEMMSHALIATVAYALKFNSEETAFVEHGEAWNQYLKNDFEPKWRSRQLGLPSNHFLTWTLFHTDVSFLRYHHYMAKMNEPDAWRRAEFERLARLLRPNFRDFQLPNNRGGVIWDHAWVGANGHECQAVSTNYAAYTIQALEDLTLEGVSPFGGARLMRRISNTIATNVLSGFSQGATRSSGTFPADICGDRQEIVDLANAAAPRAPYLITLSGKSRTTESKYASLPLTNLGAFGNKNQFIALAKTLKPENSSYPFLIGGIVFSLLYTGTP